MKRNVFWCPDTNTGKKEVMCFYSELIVVTLTTNYVSFNVVALRYGVYLGGEHSSIKSGVTNDVEDFVNIDGAGL